MLVIRINRDIRSSSWINSIILTGIFLFNPEIVHKKLRISLLEAPEVK